MEEEEELWRNFLNLLESQNLDSTYSYLVFLP
jgi:hypothetical protein